MLISHHVEIFDIYQFRKVIAEATKRIQRLAASPSGLARKAIAKSWDKLTVSEWPLLSDSERRSALAVVDRATQLLLDTRHLLAE